LKILTKVIECIVKGLSARELIGEIRSEAVKVGRRHSRDVDTICQS